MVKTRFGHWTSRAASPGHRPPRSSGEFEGKDPRAALWSPLVVWDPAGGRWNLFYVAYPACPRAGALSANLAGESAAPFEGPGADGTAGRSDGGACAAGPLARREDLQGTDSFFPWPVGGRWRAFYGSARTETKPITHWLVGPAEASALAGPWRRVREGNPAPIEARFIENPIVTEVPGGGWLAVYDGETADGIGWGYSEDGVRWSKGQGLVLQPKAGEWSDEMRTLLGLDARGRGPLHALLHGV